MLKIKKLVLTGLTSLLLLSGVAVPVFAESYSDNPYGECAYGRECPPPPEPTSPPPAPPPAPQPEPTPPGEPQTNLTLNLQDGEVINSETFTLIARVSRTDNQPSGAAWVTFYVNDRVIATVYDPAEDGSFRTVWRVTEQPGTKVTAVAFDGDGKAISRQDVLVKVDDNLFTVGPATPPTTTPPAAPPQSGFLGETGRQIQEALRQVPPEVARSFPYWLFLLLALLALQLLWQAVRESINARRLAVILKREELIAEEKDNFLMLSSHYLLTPLTVMKNGADTMGALKEATPEALAPLTTAIGKLQQRINAVLADVQSNAALKNVAAPNQAQPQTNVLKRAYFWIPVGLVSGLYAIANFLLGYVGQQDLGFTNMWVQFLVFLVVIAFLYTAMRTHHLRQNEESQARLLVEHQYTVDLARNNFIQQSMSALRENLQEIFSAVAAMPSGEYSKYVVEGYSRFASILKKFEMLSQLQAGQQSNALEEFSLKSAVDSIIAPYQAAADERRIRIANDVPESVHITQNRHLFEFVLSSVLDNAVKFSQKDGVVRIVANQHSGKLMIEVQDGGIGVPEEKLPHLFQPFSRVGSALQFDYEGMGFSLFLDRIIMDYLGGEINADSKQDQGTKVSVLA